MGAPGSPGDTLHSINCLYYLWCWDVLGCSTWAAGCAVSNGKCLRPCWLKCIHTITNDPSRPRAWTCPLLSRNGLESGYRMSEPFSLISSKSSQGSTVHLPHPTGAGCWSTPGVGGVKFGEHQSSVVGKTGNSLLSSSVSGTCVS